MKAMGASLEYDSITPWIVPRGPNNSVLQFLLTVSILVRRFTRRTQRMSAGCRATGVCVRRVPRPKLALSAGLSRLSAGCRASGVCVRRVPVRRASGRLRILCGEPTARHPQA